MIKIKMAGQQTQQVQRITQDKLRDIQLPILETNGREELLVGVMHSRDIHEHYQTVKRDGNEKIVLTEYRRDSNGNLFEAFTDHIKPEGDDKFRFYDDKLRSAGL